MGEESIMASKYDEVFENRRKTITEHIFHNELYVSMKTKEIAILLQIPREKIHEL